MQRAAHRHLGRFLSLVVSGLALSLAACGGSDATAPSPAQPEPYGHVHGLGVNPRDGALFIATHSGLFRANRDGNAAMRVGDTRRDLMGFTVVAEDTFLASGHPDAREDAPPHLGLIVTDDAGRGWRDLALRGQADLHIIRVGNRLTYAYDAISGGLFVSPDAASTWRVAQPPAPLIDFVVDPENERHLIAATEGGLYRSKDRGSDWRRAGDAPPGLLVWERAGARRVLLFTLDGEVHRSADKGRTWKRLVDVGATPTAATSDGRRLYVAAEDGTVLHSTDGGRTWSVRLRSPE